MSVGTGIEWTDATWNPIRGCSRVSEGCRHCYAETVAHRFSGPGLPYAGLTTAQGRWNGTLVTVPEHLDDPLRWTKPRRVFVNSMSDLFHEHVDRAYVDRIFAVMHLADRHVFQVLTKRPERMRAYLADPETPARIDAAVLDGVSTLDWGGKMCLVQRGGFEGWPLPNVWLGVSVEDQATADARIPLLLQTPAAVRFISAEPLLGPVDASPWLKGPLAALKGILRDDWLPPVEWVIVGGESGRGARPCDVAWVRSLVRQCQHVGVPCFVKQLGARPVAQHPMQVGALVDAPCADPKGGDMDEWPDDLRVRQFPGGAR